MEANDIRKLQAEYLKKGMEQNAIHLEIALQLAELNEKFTDYFQTLGPDELDKKRGIR